MPVLPLYGFACVLLVNGTKSADTSMTMPNPIAVTPPPAIRDGRGGHPVRERARRAGQGSG